VYTSVASRRKGFTECLEQRFRVLNLPQDFRITLKFSERSPWHTLHRIDRCVEFAGKPTLLRFVGTNPKRSSFQIALFAQEIFARHRVGKNLAPLPEVLGIRDPCPTPPRYTRPGKRRLRPDPRPPARVRSSHRSLDAESRRAWGAISQSSCGQSPSHVQRLGGPAHSEGRIHRPFQSRPRLQDLSVSTPGNAHDSVRSSSQSTWSRRSANSQVPSTLAKVSR
jgi:hypothetical protein